MGRTPRGRMRAENFLTELHIECYNPEKCVNLTPNWSPTAFPGPIPSEKALGMPNVHKSYDIPIKARN